jgi:hypothetical protein
MATATFMLRGGAGAMAVSRADAPTPLIWLGDVGNRHRLKPRPPVPGGLPLAGTTIKARCEDAGPTVAVGGRGYDDGPFVSLRLCVNQMLFPG